MSAASSGTLSRGRSRTRRPAEVAAVVAVLAVLAACSGERPEESRSADGVLGCAASAAWGSVTTVTPQADRLRVVLTAERWVVPAQGDATVEFVADDPAAETGAPAWKPGDRGLLVLDQDSPPALYADDIGTELEKAWRDAGARRLTDCRLEASPRP